MQDADIDDITLTPAENRAADGLLLILKDLEGVRKALQWEKTTLLWARDMQDETIADFPALGCKLSSTADIVHGPHFEAAVCRIQAGEDDAMTADEMTAAAILKCPDREDVPAPSSHRLSICERAAKRRKLSTGPSKRYIDTRFITPTSNVCERFFSVAGTTIGDLRRRLHTENIEAQMFLHCNMILWGVMDVNNVL